MDTATLPSLVSVEWLARHRGDHRLHIVDASWHLPGTGRVGADEFVQGHIPGAVFFDIDRIADSNTDLPHMLPPAADFARSVGALGIGNGDTVVVYDAIGLFSAARVWWMFRVFGHPRIAILDGGLPAWISAGYPLEAGWPEPETAAFDARLDADAVWHRDDVAHNLQTEKALVLDARSAGRFAGRTSEPRPGLRMGHIPGSVNLPYDRLLDPATGQLRAPEALRPLFAGAEGTPVVCSCGTGVTACVLAFGLHRIGHDKVAVYDGSWTEWGGRSDTPVATGN